MTTAPATTSAPPRRARKADRRQQLLDAAADLVVHKGLQAFTMEGLAVAAGVSKALPYQHFANRDEALLALLAREIGRLAGAISTACTGLDDGDGDEMITRAITAYFDLVTERGALLNSLAGAGSPLPEQVGGGTRPAPWFVVDLVRRGYGLGGDKAVVVSWLITALAIAGSDSVGRGDAARTVVEPITVAAAISAARAAVG